ncbi:hypothetical protein AAFF_G00063200 [Aldrovandia affinis]|uniref:Uncharacterized protein n=1 Tax=Aldrovandia affinis TaxID=143900 RepID=A0AAD7RZM0_9TELE|nr:hypothetical protein AAFF_G00063200 [Aldrovandia affinis]
MFEMSAHMFYESLYVLASSLPFQQQCYKSYTEDLEHRAPCSQNDPRDSSTHPGPAVPANTPSLRHGEEGAEWRRIFLSPASHPAYLSTMSLLPESTDSH